jgi:tripartite-type tricarboxylate transporter receptor subunit TctC
MTVGFARASLAIGLLLGGACVASAQSPAEFYKGKTIQLLVGFGPGGEDDVWARTIAKHIGNHIPGNPAMVPVHAPGSGGLLVVNRLYNAAPKDGSVVGMINRGIPFEPLLGGQGTQFDAQKINYLGSPGRDTTVCAARKDAAVQSAQDLYSQELTLGGTGSGADAAIYPEFLAALLGMKMKVVKGYKGSHEIHLAMERNEVQGICLAYDSLLRGNLSRQGQLNILLQATIEPDARIKDVPLGLEQAHSPEERAALELFLPAPRWGGRLWRQPRCRRIASRRCAPRSRRCCAIPRSSMTRRSSGSTSCRSPASSRRRSSPTPTRRRPRSCSARSRRWAAHNRHALRARLRSCRQQ